jgi:hypothetical protein
MEQTSDGALVFNRHEAPALRTIFRSYLRAKGSILPPAEKQELVAAWTQASDMMFAYEWWNGQKSFAQAAANIRKLYKRDPVIFEGQTEIIVPNTNGAMERAIGWAGLHLHVGAPKVTGTVGEILETEYVGLSPEEDTGDILANVVARDMLAAGEQARIWELQRREAEISD